MSASSSTTPATPASEPSSITPVVRPVVSPVRASGRRLLLIALAMGMLLGVLIDRLIAVNAGATGAAIVAIVLGLMGLTLGAASFVWPSNAAFVPNPQATVSTEQNAGASNAGASNAGASNAGAQLDLLGTNTAPANITFTKPIITAPNPLRWFSARGPLGLTTSSALMFAAGLCLAIGGQFMISNQSTSIGVFLFIAAVPCVILALRGSTAISTPLMAGVADADSSGKTLPMEWQMRVGALALLAGAGAFAFSGGNRYTNVGVAVWVLSMVLWLLAFIRYRPWLRAGMEGLRGLSTLRPSQWVMVGLLILTLFIGIGFRFYNLRNNPRDMNSDHTEKLLDITSVLEGTNYIFFENNTGREPWQFYWTIALAKILNIPADFMALKLGTALIGSLMLPAIYLLGRELFGWRVGVIALLFAGVTSWVVLAQRFGLRHGLNPAMVAWTMFFLVRGLKRNSRNAMLASGIAMGIGLQGYTPFRFMPIVYGVIVISWAVWQRWQGNRAAPLWATKHMVLAVLTALLVIMPLFRYALESPDSLFYRTASRLTALDKPIDGNPREILLDNIKRAVLAFNYVADEVWVANLSDRPALDPVLGGLLVAGAIMAIGLSLKRREPWPLLMLLTAFLMLMPSALNIAYPRENPSMLRIGGAMPMLMVLCALVPGLLWEWASSRGQLAILGGAVSLITCGGVLLLNYDRVFNEYPKQYCPRSQNASDIAADMAGFVARGNDISNAYVVGFPHWVDSRAVGVFIGNIRFANTIGQFIGQRPVDAIELNGQPGWFALAPDDADEVALLQANYPQGVARLVYSPQCKQDKSFMVFETQP